MRSRVGTIVAGSILIAACSGGGGDVSDRSTSPVPITAPVDSTDATTTTAWTTTTSPAPTTTVDPTAALIAEIEADLNEGEQALIAAVAAPGDPTAETLVRTYFADQALETVIATLTQLSADGLVARPNPSVPNVVAVRELLDAKADSATIEVCRVDALVVVDSLPNGGEAIVNDQVTTVVSESSVRKIDGLWVLSSGNRVEDLVGATTCS